MDQTQFLAFAAQTKGATGVREYLQDHRQKAPDVLQELRELVLLDEGDAPSVADFGIRLEQLPRKVQREIWCALASGASPREEDAVDLARAFLEVVARPRRRESDGVCLSLAKMLLSGEEEQREETMADAAFRRRMRRLTLNRVKFPSQEEEDAMGLHTTLSSGSAAGSRKVHQTSSLTKRPRGEALQDRYSMDEAEQDPRIEAGSQTHPATKSQERPPLRKEIEDRAAALAKQLAHLSHADARAAVDDLATRVFGILAEVVNDVHTTYAANERSFQCLCQMLRMDAASDEVLLQITSALVDSNWSSRYASIFLETSVLPKIRAAESVISRVLLQTALRFGSSYTSALVDSLLLPLLVGGCNPDTDRSFGPAQAEAITRILHSPDTVPPDQLDGFIQKSLSSVTASEENNSKQHLLTNESVLLVFQNILNMKPALSSLTLEMLIGACETALEQPEGRQLRGSLKFSTVVFTLISKYPQQCTGHVESLEAIASHLTSIMTKTIIRSLEKLKISK